MPGPVLRIASTDSGSRPLSHEIAALFPLRLTDFENYMFVDDRPSHPMAFVIELEFSGELDVNALDRAVTQALRRHPLLSARIARRLRGRCWVPCDQRVRATVVSDKTLADVRVGHINIRREPGVKVWILPTDSGGQVFFQFHHAATDGLGSMQFIGDVLVDYARATASAGDELPERRPLDVQVLKRRGSTADPVGSDGPSRLTRVGQFGRQLGTSASRLVTPLREKRPFDVHGGSLHTLPPFVRRTGDRTLLRALKQSAAKRMLHVNDLLIAATFKTVHDWNRCHDTAENDRLIRLAVPSSLRTPDHDLSPAANILNLVYVNRRESECGDLELLLDCADEAANASTHDRVFNWAMGVGRKIPGLVELCSRLPYCFATIVLTNVGDVKRQFGTRFPMKRGRCVAGSLTLEGLRGTSPLRAGTHVGLSVGTYASQLLVNATCDPHRYSRQDADEFVDLFFVQLSELAADKTMSRVA